MKKLLSLCLAFVLLLSLVPSVAAEGEQQYFTEYSLSLKESIAITFKIAQNDLPDGATKVEFYKDEICVQTIELPVEVKADGYYWFTCNKLAPHEMGVDITAKLYIGDEVVDEATKAVTDYCGDVFGDANAAQGLRKLAVDMLHYGAASQAYVGDSADKVNAGLAEEQLAWGSDTSVDPVVEYVGKQSEKTGSETVEWKEASLTLSDSVGMTFVFTTTEAVEGLSVAISCGEQNWSVDSFKSLGENTYSFTFAGLNPAMMREKVEAVIKSGDAAVSTTVTYSIASYASKVMEDDGASAELKALVKAMVRYGDAAAAYVEGADAAHVYDESGRCTVCATAHYAVSKNVWIEAEDADLLSGQTSENSNSMYSGGKAVLLTPNDSDKSNTDPSATPLVSVDVTPDSDGDYYIWLRMFNGNKRFYVYVDDDDNTNQKYVQHQPGDENKSSGNPNNETCDPIWMKLPYTYTWTEGESYTVRIRVYDTLIRLDQIVVTKDAEFAPNTHVHTYEGKWTYDSDSHWKVASCCMGITTEPVDHAHENGSCVCGHNLFYQTVQAEDTKLMTEFDSTAEKKDQSPTLRYEITETTGKVSTTGNVVRMYIGNTTAQADDAPAHLSFEVTPEEDGEYYVWIKYYLAGGVDAYTYVYQKVEGVDTSWKNTPVKPGTGFVLDSNANYGWFKLSTAQWEGGETYTVGLRSRAVALYIDEFVITNDSAYIPQ